MTDWMTAQLAKAGIKALDQGNSTFTAGVKGIRIVVCVLCIPRFVLRDNRPSWADLGLWSQPITKALPLELRQQFTDCHQFQMVKHQLKLSILQRFVMKWLCGSLQLRCGLPLIHTDEKRIQWDEVSGEINEGGWGHFVWGIKTYCTEFQMIWLLL